MNPFILLIICVGAQILIAAGLGIFLFRRYLRRKKEKEASPATAPEGLDPPP